MPVCYYVRTSQSAGRPANSNCELLTTHEALQTEVMLQYGLQTIFWLLWGTHTANVSLEQKHLRSAHTPQIFGALMILIVELIVTLMVIWRKNPFAEDSKLPTNSIRERWRNPEKFVKTTYWTENYCNWSYWKEVLWELYAACQEKQEPPIQAWRWSVVSSPWKVWHGCNAQYKRQSNRSTALQLLSCLV